MKIEKCKICHNSARIIIEKNTRGVYAAHVECEKCGNNDGGVLIQEEHFPENIQEAINRWNDGQQLPSFKIEPCPFCGTVGEICLEEEPLPPEERIHLRPGYFVNVKCPNCGHCETEKRGRIEWDADPLDVFECVSRTIRRWNPGENYDYPF